MDPRLFFEWAQIDDRLRRAIIVRDVRRTAARISNADRSVTADVSRSQPDRGEHGGLLFIVAREARKEQGTYEYLEYALAADGGHVIVDRRKEDRRQIDLRARLERRGGERRRSDVMTDLGKSGWALVPCWATAGGRGSSGGS